MKTINFILKLIVILWQLPQVIIGSILYLWYNKSIIIIKKVRHTKVYSCNMPGGISLGTFIFINRYQCTNDTINHELGHAVQSMILGPLYLIVIGIPSIIWAGIHKYDPNDKNSYYRFYTERWADKLGGVTRD